MAYFSLKANCSFCGKDLGLFAGNGGRIELIDGWICDKCRKRLTDGYSIPQLREMKVTELSGLINDVLLAEKEIEKMVDETKNISKAEMGSLMKVFNVSYLGGIPGHMERYIHSNLEFYEKMLRLVNDRILFFGPIVIPYSNIYSIESIEVSVQTNGYYYGSKVETFIQIKFCYNGKDYIINMDLTKEPPLHSKMNKNQNLLDFIELSGIRSQFLERKKEEKIIFSIADELKKFNNLLKEGAITQEEYEQKKKELLNM